MVLLVASVLLLYPPTHELLGLGGWMVSGIGAILAAAVIFPRHAQARARSREAALDGEGVLSATPPLPPRSSVPRLSDRLRLILSDAATLLFPAAAPPPARDSRMVLDERFRSLDGILRLRPRLSMETPTIRPGMFRA